MRVTAILFFLFISAFAFSQESLISGRVVENSGEAISFATILISETPTEEIPKGAFIAGTTSDDEGIFNIITPAASSYIVTISYVGFTPKTIEVTAPKTLGDLTLERAAEALEEAIITVKGPTIKKEPGKLTFNVEKTSLSTGSTLDILSKTPGVVVANNRITVKNISPVVFINNKRVYLSQSEVISLLQNVDGEIIKSIEVITQPSAKYDAEAGTVLNIITSKAVSVGYKGSVNGTYEQATFAKYRLGTSHFYKNDWVNLFGSYSVSPRKEVKQDENNSRFFNPDEVTTKSFRDSYFEKTTQKTSHQANVVADFTLDENQSLSVSATAFFNPNEEYRNKVNSLNYNAARQLDSTFVTHSDFKNEQANISLNVEHVTTIGEKGVSATSNINYITYNNERNQSVDTDYFLANGQLDRISRFETAALQESNIVTAQTDFAIPLKNGNLETGLKYSNISTDSGLDFFDINGATTTLNASLSDFFKYTEDIFAGYINYDRDWGKWAINVGTRGEHTAVKGDSRSLGTVNNQNYFKLFPNASISRVINEKNSVNIGYVRRIHRPRYQSLNPFKYFINESNFNEGDPNLVPAIDDKFSVGYNFKNTWFVDAYYIHTNDGLEVITYQNNQNNTLQNIDTNVPEGHNLSFDIVYASPVKSWWYLQVVTSTFYLKNTFNALQSSQETASVDTFGLYAQMYSGLTLSRSAGLTSDVTALYISNLIYGAAEYNNQFNLSFSLRKSFWKKQASVTLGVDDIFNKNNVALATQYLNQDSRFFARPESRLFRLGFKYNFGNARLRDNNKTTSTDEGDRL